MERVRKYFEELGFGKNEIEIYLSLTGIGKSTVTKLAKKTSIHRANIYESLEHLIKKGMVFQTEDEKKEYYARDPVGLKGFIERKKLETEEVVKELKSYTSSNPDSSIGQTKGKFSLKEAFFDLLNTKNEIKIFGFTKEILKIIGPSIQLFEEKRIKNNIKLMIIVNNQSFEKTRESFKELAEIKTLPEKYDSKITTFLTDDKILLVRSVDEILVTHINCELITEQYSDYFDILWSKAS